MFLPLLKIARRCFMLIVTISQVALVSCLLPSSPGFYEGADIVKRGQLQLVPAMHSRVEVQYPTQVYSARLRIGIGGAQEVRLEARVPMTFTGLETNLTWKAGIADIIAITGGVGLFTGLSSYPRKTSSTSDKNIHSDIYTVSGYDLGLGAIFSTGAVSESRRIKPYMGIRASVNQDFGCASLSACGLILPAVAVGIRYAARSDTTVMFELGYGGRYPLYPFNQDARPLPGIAEHSGYFGVGVGLDLLHRSRPSPKQPPSAQASAQLQAAPDLQALVAEADEAMRRGDYAAAAPRLMELYQRTANPVWLCDAGEAQRRQFAWAAAHEAFTRCLAAAPQASYAPMIRQILQQLPSEERRAQEAQHGTP